MAVTGSTGVLMLVLFGIAHFANAELSIEISFLRYSDTCRENVMTSPCDPKFYFCLDRPRPPTSISSCYYRKDGLSGYFQDTNIIDMSVLTSIGGIPNPWIVKTKQLMDSSFLFVAKVEDDDIWKDDDLVTFGLIMSQPIYPSKSEAVWAFKKLTWHSYMLSFKIRLYCEANYYSNDCTKYCIASGHYTCHPQTGDKVCMKGWTGPDCSQDIDECTLGYCRRGTCENLPGEYVCTCSQGYIGKNCSMSTDPCSSQPCNNNGICMNGQNMDYSCICVGNWEGEFCNMFNPCKSGPCQNGGKCIPSFDYTTYYCDCLNSTTGTNCETLSDDATLKPDLSNDNGGGNHTSTYFSEAHDGFKYWYIIVIVALLLFIIAIVVICLVVRRKHRRQADTWEHNSGNGQAFDNQVYSGQFHKNSKSPDKNQHPPILPASLIGVEGMPPIPLFIISNGRSMGVTVSDHKDKLPMKAIKKAYANITERLNGNNLAMENLYTSCGTMSSNAESHLSDDPGCQFMDELLADVSNKNETSQEQENPVAIPSDTKDDPDYQSMDELLTDMSNKNEISQEQENPVAIPSDIKALPFDSPSSNYDENIYQCPLRDPVPLRQVHVPPIPLAPLPPRPQATVPSKPHLFLDDGLSQSKC